MTAGAPQPDDTDTQGASESQGITTKFRAEYQAWKSMNYRCYVPRNPNYYKYGARGIAVCDAWRYSFATFLKDMGPRPDGKTLDRIDNDGNYTPENCRWATPYEQTHNRRLTRAYRRKGTNKYIGVMTRKDRKSPDYEVYVRVDSKIIYICGIKDEEEAAYIRDQIVLQTRDDDRSELNVLDWDSKPAQTKGERL